MCSYPSPPFHLASMVRNVSAEVSAGYLCLYYQVPDLSLLSWHSELQIWWQSWASPQSSVARRGGKKSESEGKEYCLFQFSLAFPSHSNLMQSGFSLHLITWSLTPVSHNHHVPFSVIASHFPASSNRAASLHLCRFFCTAFLFLHQCQRWLEMQEKKQQRWCFKLVLRSYLLRPNNSVPSEHSC